MKHVKQKKSNAVPAISNTFITGHYLSAFNKYKT